MTREMNAKDLRGSLNEPELCRYLEVVRVVGVRHQNAVVGALQLEAVCDASIRVAVAAEVGQTFVVAQLLEVLVVLGHASVAQVFHHTWRTHTHMYRRYEATNVAS